MRRRRRLVASPENARGSGDSEPELPERPQSRSEDDHGEDRQAGKTDYEVEGWNHNHSTSVMPQMRPETIRMRYL